MTWADAVNADGIDRIMFAFFVLTLLLLLVQHFFTYYEFSEYVVFELFSPKASQYDFHLIPRWKMQTVKVLDWNVQK